MKFLWGSRGIAQSVDSTRSQVDRRSAALVAPIGTGWLMRRCYPRRRGVNGWSFFSGERRAAADVFGFKNVGSALAIVDDPAADWGTWQPRQVVIPDLFPGDDGNQQDGDEKSTGVEILWGSDLYVDTPTGGDPTLYIFGCRQVPKKPSELVAASCGRQSRGYVAVAFSHCRRLERTIRECRGAALRF